MVAAPRAAAEPVADPRAAAPPGADPWALPLFYRCTAPSLHCTAVAQQLLCIALPPVDQSCTEVALHYCRRIAALRRLKPLEACDSDRLDWPREGDRLDWPREGDRLDWPREGDRLDWPREGDRLDWPREGGRLDWPREGDSAAGRAVAVANVRQPSPLTTPNSDHNQL
eukprot:354433-Chlamydomonas_euryale.AAC.6